MTSCPSTDEWISKLWHKCWFTQHWINLRWTLLNKEARVKGYISHDSIFMKLKKTDKTMRTDHLQWLGREKGMSTKEYLGCMRLFCIALWWSKLYSVQYWETKNERKRKTKRDQLVCWRIPGWNVECDK